MSGIAALIAGIVVLAVPLLPLPVRAQTGDGSCPATADSVPEGWICSLLILNTPTSAPTDSQIELWADVLASQGHLGVTDGIVFSDSSIDAKIDAIYSVQLGRAVDPDGLVYWRTRVQSARTEFAAEFGIFSSAEYLARFASIEAFVNSMYDYYLGRAASEEEAQLWARAYESLELSARDIVQAIATSQEAGSVRTAILYERFARRPPDGEGFDYWTERAAELGLFGAIAQFTTSAEIVQTLGEFGLARAPAPPESDAGRDFIVAPQEVVTTDVGDPVEITVLAQTDGTRLEGPLDLTLFRCDHVTATESPVVFADTDDDHLADGIASTETGQAYISTVHGEPTGGRVLYVDDVPLDAEGNIHFDVIAGPDADCAVVAVIDDFGLDRQLSLDPGDRSTEPFGVTVVGWE